MDAGLLQTLIDGGAAILAILVVSYLFHVASDRHAKERKEWKEDAKETTNKVVQALETLSSTINNKDKS